MELDLHPFEYEFKPGTIHYGRGCVSKLWDALERVGADRALVVCGENTGGNEALMTPIRRGLGDKLVAVFDGTSPDKYVGTVYDGVELMEAEDVDALVSVGGGSSLDTAHVMSAYACEGNPIGDLFSVRHEDGSVETADITGEPTPLFTVPTTLAGAELGVGGGVKLTQTPEGPPDGQVYGSVSHVKLMPKAFFYDPNLFETTPTSALTGSAMNGFDKGIENLYSRNANPLSDATAIHGLRLLRPALPHLTDDPVAEPAMDRIVAGIILVQYGRSPSPQEKKNSIVHAFGHGFSFHYEAQQGVVHGIVAPHVLRYVFENADARRELLADSLGIDTAGSSTGEVGAAVADDVATLRDELGLPSRLRELEGVEHADLGSIAAEIAHDHGMRNAPVGIDPSVEDVENVLERAW